MNQRWRHYDAFPVGENRWRAIRYGMDEGLIDFVRGQVVAFTDLLEEMIELAGEEADFPNCSAPIFRRSGLSGSERWNRQSPELIP